MNKIGQTLQQARIARGMSIHDVASETRVPRASLEAIEAGDREALPAPVFTRGFVRSFAIAVGVEPEALELAAVPCAREAAALVLVPRRDEADAAGNGGRVQGHRFGSRISR